MYKFLAAYIFFILVFFTKNASAQDFSYFTIGEEALKNAEIYSVLQTSDLRLFVATNEGLYQYKNKLMQPIPVAKGQKGISLFNLRENSKGQVFCFNLTGQIFFIDQNRLKLYAQLKPEQLGSKMAMEFDNSDNLIFTSKDCFIVKPSKIETLFHSKNTLINGLSKLPNGQVILAKSTLDTLIHISNGKLLYKTPSFKFNNDESDGFIYQLGNLTLSTDRLNKVSYTSSKKEKFNITTKYIQFNNEIIWRRKSSSGIETLTEKDGDIIVQNQYFNNIFISNINKGKQGELFFGTFGKGLIVVPNKNITRHNFKEQSTNIRSIATDDNESLFISDRVNGILKYTNGTIKKVEFSADFKPENIFYIKNKKPLFKNHDIIYNEGLVNGSLKNISVVDENTILLSSSLGVYKMGLSTVLNDNLWKPFLSSKDIYVFKNINTRCSDAIYAPSEKAMYVSTISSLLRVSNNGKKQKLLFNCQDIIANDLLLFENQIWAATQNNGILIFQNGKLIKQLNNEQNINADFVHKLEQKDDLIFISHKKGFQIFNTKESTTRNIGIAEGVESESITDFAISNNQLWLHANNQILSLPLDNIPDLDPKFSTQIDSVLVSNEPISLLEMKKLSYKKNEFVAYLDFRGIVYEKEAYYKYKLKGFDDMENLVPVTQPTIVYDYLPPGNYSFVFQTVYRNIETTPITYNFEIKKPFWQTWWFYSIVTAFVILMVFLYTFFKNRKIQERNRIKLEKQVLKSSYLESELKALRAQMNPHFIFNSLNSIQDLILKEDTDASYDYIVLFSELVRNSLTYSDQGYISFEKEVQFLETYLELEKLRFGDDFNYRITFENIDISLPSLVIQPFIENAILHGLFHKNGSKELLIDFKRHIAGVECTIIDNGVGRKKSHEIQKRQGLKKKSYALDAIKKRLEILGKKNNSKIGFKIIDLEESGNPEGTKIILILPNLEM